jgi:VIT1/CCC1 family predicted Fe2+/Mn2+ transporter
MATSLSNVSVVSAAVSLSTGVLLPVSTSVVWTEPLVFMVTVTLSLLAVSIDGAILRRFVRYQGG